MHNVKASNEFDFDDWAGLYLESPEEFEARRQAVLMIELARCSPEQAESCRQLLASYETMAEGCTEQQRMLIASKMMMESAHQLSAELQVLKQEL